MDSLVVMGTYPVTLKIARGVTELSNAAAVRAIIAAGTIQLMRSRLVLNRMVSWI